MMEVEHLACGERSATAALIAHLAELDARRLYLGAGFTSTFTYCTEVLRLSEGGAYNRIEAAHAARKFPLVLDLLEQGALNVTTARSSLPISPQRITQLFWRRRPTRASVRSRSSWSRRFRSRTWRPLCARCRPRPFPPLCCR